MSEHEETQDNDSFLNLAECQELKRKVALASPEMIELTYNEEKFNGKLEELNRQACAFIEEEKYPQAAVYLDEAERVLEYAAGCGKTIERSLITTILNNQACLLQRTSDFEQSANYLEAIIFNINDFLEGTPNVPLSHHTANCHTQEYADFSTFLERKISLALYHLRFCALTSHSKNNELALKSARKALRLLSEVTAEEHSYEIYCEKSQGSAFAKPKDDCLLASFFREMATPASLDHSSEEFQQLLNKALGHIKVYKQNCDQHQFGELQEMFDSYSIGNLMQASVLQINLKPNPREFMEKEFSLVGKAFRAIHTSMAYFTVATELRLISAAKYALDDDVRKSSEEYKESKAYHLVSIMLIARFLPFKSVFYDHAIYSFKNHYALNLEELAQNYQAPSHHGTPSRQERDSKARSEVSAENNRTMQIHEAKENIESINENLMRNSETTHRQFHIAQIQNRNLDSKKIKTVKSRSKFLKMGPESTKTIESEKNAMHHSKNKENKSKNSKLLSRGKETVSRAKLAKPEEDDEQRKAIYYGFTSKSRSKSKKEIGLERRGSKKGLLTMKSGLVPEKKAKNETKIEQQYGVKSLGGFNHKLITSKVKKMKPLRTSHEEEGQYLIKFNKMPTEQAHMKKLKSPRQKKETSSRKTLSRDKCNL